MDNNSGNGTGAKQQIVDRIRQSTNILITVSSNPSVDALSAALALALMLNKMDKHATAVFSGAVPPAINFLQPDKTFEHNVDSLRDFIIALDKEKADRLRYKVENDVVRIYITPYRSEISEKDLRFSQGDFNVDMIVALGVEKREELDKAIVAHGRILHDATVMTINAAAQRSNLGVVDWQDTTASSLSEMLTSMADSLQPNLLDPQISTALLTGIVAATDRFSNQHTTPRVMTMAAQLMAAGANQQLIASNLIDTSQLPKNMPIPSGAINKPSGAPVPDANAPKGEMHIEHVEPQEIQPMPPQPPKPSLVAPVQPAPAPNLQQQPQNQPRQQNQQQQPKPQKNRQFNNTRPSWMDRNDGRPPERGEVDQPPTFGGSLSATAEEALEDKLRDETEARNHTILTHEETPPNDQIVTKKPLVLQPLDAIAPAPAPVPTPTLLPNPTPVATLPAPAPSPAPKPSAPAVELPPLPPEPVAPTPAPRPVAPLLPPTPPPVMDAVPLKTEPSIEQLQAPAPEKPAYDPQADIAAARKEVNEAFDETPFDPAGHPLQSLGAQDVPVEPVPAAETPAPASAIPIMPVPTPQAPASTLPPMPPLPDFSTLPPAPDSLQQPTLPPLPQTPTPPVAPSPPLPAATSSNDPAQFKIPGSN
ncbi:MAG TPA: hypothetical protein VNG90_04255 [Candidatus Acidoferrum sp.]|nr:hypothetical protein [Candidatus Acidoferrum sp.]